MKPTDTSATATRCRDLFGSAVAVAVTASLLAGCATTDSRLLPPPSEQLRSHMLSVTVASAGSVTAPRGAKYYGNVAITFRAGMSESFVTGSPR